MLNDRVTGADKIRYHLDIGYAISQGIAQDLAGSSGGRTLRKIIAKNPSKYRYVWIKGKESKYKAFFDKSNTVKALQIHEVTGLRSSVTGYCFECYLSNCRVVLSQPEKSKNKLKQQIKQCGV